MRKCPGITLLIALFFAACATPIPPPGGPADVTPPVIVETAPAAGSINFSGESVRITFSEYVDQASIGRALSITPPFERLPEFGWRGRTLEIRFPEPLRQNTTYVITLDTNLRDAHGVALTSPTTIAFSTGPTISRGVISGRLVDNRAGTAASGVDVFAYTVADSAAPSAIPPRPEYRTQTGPDGAFRFDYLTEQFYYVAAVRDANRNLRPDPLEAFAPPPAPAVRADSTPVELGIPWVLAQLDSIPPQPLRIQSLSQTRHVLRTSEDVRFVEREPEEWMLIDSASGSARAIEDLYILASDPRQVFFTTPPLGTSVHSLTAAALVDTSGNTIRDQPISFTPSASEDTVATRFLAFLPANAVSPFTLPEGVEPTVRFNVPVDAKLLGEAVAVRDSMGTALAFDAVTRNGTDYEILPQPRFDPDARIEISVDGGRLANPDSIYTAVYERLSASLMGEITGTVISSHPVIVEAHPVEVDVTVPPSETRADADGSFIFRNMPAGTYRLRAFADADGDGRWDVGTIVPYRAPEGITWRGEPARVRARWETALPDTLRIPTIRP